MRHETGFPLKYYKCKTRGRAVALTGISDVIIHLPQLVEVRLEGDREGNIFVTCARKNKWEVIDYPYFFCNFRGTEYYLISLRSVQIRIFCLWLKYAFFVNSKHYSQSNGTKGNFKPWKYLLLNSVL